MSDTAVAAVPENANEGDTRNKVALSTPAVEPAKTDNSKQAAKPVDAKPVDAKPAKPSDAPKDAPKDEKPAEGKPEGVPETYADFSFPEGTEAWGKGVVDVFGEAAKNAGLTQTQAQKFIEKMAPGYLQTQQQQVRAMVEKWADETTHDKEIGGDKLEATMSTARRVFNDDRLVSPAFRAFLKETGIECHPEMIRMFARLGSRVSDDKIVDEGTPDPEAVTGDVFSDPKAAARIMYPKKKS